MMSDKRSFPRTGTITLGTLVIIGLATALIRFERGLGATTNLGDGRPWGLWISLDLYCGVALAAGGFVMAGAVYIFGLKKYYPVVRSAILTAFLGYLMVIVSLLVDLGQPWRIWHMIIYWNPHSPLFEVGWCVLLYTVVLSLEFSPAVFERFKMKAPLKWIRVIQIPLIIAGIVLSTLHQSSLGSVLLMMPDKIHPLWFTPVLPVLFFLSAVAAGAATTLFEVSFGSRITGHVVNLNILQGLGRGIVRLLAFYLAARFGDLIVENKLALIFTSGAYSLMFMLELSIGVIIPLILFSLPAVQRSRKALSWSALPVIAGLALHRFNVSLIALTPRTGTFYFPHLLEFVISISIIAGGILAYMMANRYLPVLPQTEDA